MPGDDVSIKSRHFFSNKSKTVNGAFVLLQDGYKATPFGQLEREVPPVLPAFCVSDCDEALRRVEEFGGKTQWSVIPM